MAKENQNQNQNQNQNPKTQQQQQQQKEDFSLKETTPNISAGRVISGDRLPTAFDLVEKMQFLFARVVRGKDLPETGDSETCDPYVEVKVGTFVGKTRPFQNTKNPEWNQVFAFSKERIQDQVLEIRVKDNKGDSEPDHTCLGRVAFTISDVPMRVPPDSPLAPQWYKLEDQKGVKLVNGELMVSVWMGTQADEGFPDAWHSDSVSGEIENIAYTRSKVYISPRLWYLRVNVIQAQDLILKGKGGSNNNNSNNNSSNNNNNNNNNNSEIFIQGVLGNLALRSRSVKINTNTNNHPMWNEDLMFVAAEPFDEPLLLSIEKGQGNSNKHERLGSCLIPLKNVQKRIDATPPPNVWYNLETPKEETEEQDKVKIAGRINLRISLDGGYHVLDEATNYTSDLRASSKQLSTPSIGVLELGILNAVGLAPNKKDNRTDAYCVAKYGPKWVRTRTIVNSLSPKWNEQYTWEVYDPCTVVTIVVFDNGRLQHGGKIAQEVNSQQQGGKNNVQEPMDKRIGKVRIRLSTLESDRIYTHSYPLINLHNQGVRKVGEIQLAVRFSCPSLLNVLQTYAQPLLPKMHYISPLSIFQLDSLRNQAAAVTILRFRRAEPPLSKEVVEYMLDVRANVWSMRRGRAQFYRIASLLSGFAYVAKLFDEICSWKNKSTTITSYVIFLIVIFCPGIVLPATFFILLLLGIWRYRSRPRHPSHMDMNLSHADTATNEELEEEFDPFPSKFSGDNLKKRYDRLRGIMGRVLEVMGDLATQEERFQSLLSWRDPRATSLFVIFCLVAAIVTYFTPFRILILVWVSYLLRPPRLRFDMPAVPQHFLRRMPAKSDGLL